MAWNEPGNNGQGNGPKDPWGGNDQGPPDLDEALRKFQERLGGIFGGNSGGGSGGSSNSFSASSLLVFAVVGALIWLASGLYQVDQQERAIILRLGEYHETKEPGLRWNPRFIDSREIVNVTNVRTERHNAAMLTEDENIVEVYISVQYRVVDPKNFVLEVRDPKRSLQHAMESALRHVVGSSEMHQVLTEGRENIAILVEQRLQEYLALYQTGIELTKVNIEDTRPPEEVKAAFDDVIKAREDEVREKNQAEAYSKGIIPEARGLAQRQIEEANAYKEQVIAQAEGEASRFEKLLEEYRKAPQVTRERLYLDAMEDVMTKTSKVMVDVEGGNNLLYLPLDKLMQQGQSSRTEQLNLTDGGVRQITDRVVQQLEREGQRRRRESR